MNLARSKKNTDHYFLKGGGEMGALMRSKDWSQTPLGDPSDWPPCLCTMVAVMLENPFGMYIAWGPDFIQLYNDAYRPILGANKHPQALGISTRETFTEIWHIIESMFDGVMNGIPVGFPDFMLPLNRNGFIEECYFDFSYSPIRDHNGSVGGVLVTVIETTNKRLSEGRLREINHRFRNTMKQAPVGITILNGPQYLVEMANDAYLQLVGKTESEFVGKPLFETLPEVKEAVHSLLDKVLYSGQPYHGNEVPIPLNRNGIQNTFYFDFLYQPLKEDDGTISGVIAIVTEVTEKVEARKSIEERKRLYETITQTTPDLIYVFDLNYRFSYANEALLNMWGLSWEESIGKGMLEVGYEPWHAEMHEREIDQVIATKKPIRGEVSFPHAILGKRYYDYIFAPIIDQEGNVEAIAGTTRDISPQVEARKAIEESEERFRSLAQALPQLTWVTDDKGNSEFASTKWNDYTGIEPGGEKEWQAIVHPEDYEAINTAWIHSLSTGEFYKAYVRLRSKNGEYRWHTVNGEPVYDKENKIVKWVGAFTDTHVERTLSQELEAKVNARTAELKASEEKFFSLFNLSPICKTLSDAATGKIVMVNDAFSKLFGYSSEEILDKTSEEVRLLEPEDRKYIIHELRVNGKIANKEIGFIKKSGKRFIALISAEMITMGDKQYFLSAFNDISEIKQAEQHIKQKNIELEKMNNELQSFAYVSSHDLQEPLRKIQTFASLISETEEANLSPNGKDMFQRMQNAAKRMQTLIQDLLAYSRTNTSDNILETMDLNVILAEVKEELMEELKEKKAIIEINPLGEAEIIRFQFKQLMHNLIGNSLKFSRKDLAPRIQISGEIRQGAALDHPKLSPKSNYCHITMSDNGIGFDQQYSEKIFEVFQRLHGKHEYNGTGIGLSIVKKIVENHKGYISATGEVNKGARFDIFIPTN